MPILPTLRRHDGYGHTTPNLRGDVERLQRALQKAGVEVGVDGLFGAATERAVTRFQRDNALLADGVVGPETWAALRPYLAPRDRTPPFPEVAGFETFRGDLDWVHEREGHAGRPYWPGGRSGVTLDPGFDLGYQTPARAGDLYGDFLSAEELRAVSAVTGVTGSAAQVALAADPVLGAIRVSRTRAARIMPHVAVRYWTAVAGRFPTLDEADTPGSVQTALLSLAYNRGPGNADLAVLEKPLRKGRWLGVARHIGRMQQDHALPGIRIRRRQEADLIRQEIA
jgi:peptidoglycan hydrolase-like protein with peptidoglycan-binding domain